MYPDLTPKTFFTALALAIVLLIPWEFYWRNVQQFKPGFDESAERPCAEIFGERPRKEWAQPGSDRRE